MLTLLDYADGRRYKSWFGQLFNFRLSGVYTGEKTLNIVAIASGGDLKRWENFY
jgi:hypothetical protein